jgi:hypothetical protein
MIQTYQELADLQFQYSDACQPVVMSVLKPAAFLYAAVFSH